MRVLIRGCSIVHCLFPDSELGPEQGKSRVWGVSTPHTITVSRLQVDFRTIKETSPLSVEVFAIHLLSSESPGCHMTCTPPKITKPSFLCSCLLSHDVLVVIGGLIIHYYNSFCWFVLSLLSPYIIRYLYVWTDNNIKYTTNLVCVRCPNLNGNTSL